MASPPPKSHARAVLILATLAVTLAVFAPSLGNGFTMDDRSVAMGIGDDGQPHPLVFELRPLADYFTSHYWRGTLQSSRLYRPVTILSYALRYRLFGDAPLPAHAINLGLHLLSVLLVWRMLAALGAGRMAIFLGSLLFGLHAIHSEVVASVVGRAELLAFVCGSSALLLWHGARRRSGLRRALALGSSSLLLFCAFGAKESALAWVPCMFVFACATTWQETAKAISWARIGRICARVALVSLLPLLVYFLLRARMLSGLDAPPPPISPVVNPLAWAPALTRICTGVSILGYGLYLTALPLHLAADYGAHVFEILEGPGEPRFLAAAAALLICLGAGLGLRRRAPLLFLAMAVFLGFTFLTSNLPLPIGTLFAERLYYTPSLACSLIVAWLWPRSRGRLRWLLATSLALWLSVSAVVISRRDPVWRDDATLFLHEARSQPRSARMQLCAAAILTPRGELEAARDHLRRAVALSPNYALAWNNLAAALFRQKRLGEAEAALRRGLATPDWRAAGFQLHFNLGLVLSRQNRVPEAAAEFERCLLLRPGYLRGFEELWTMRRVGALTAQRLTAILLDGAKRGSSDPHWTLYRGLLARREGRPREAVALLRQALRRLPRHADGGIPHAAARLALGETLLELDRRTEGLAILRELAGDRFAPTARREQARHLLPVSARQVESKR